MEGLNAKFKHFKHITKLELEEEDEKATETLQQLVEGARQSGDELSNRVLSKLDDKVLKLCARTARTSGLNNTEGALQPLVINTPEIAKPA